MPGVQRESSSLRSHLAAPAFMPYIPGWSAKQSTSKGPDEQRSQWATATPALAPTLSALRSTAVDCGGAGPVPAVRAGVPAEPALRCSSSCLPSRRNSSPALSTYTRTVQAQRGARCTMSRYHGHVRPETSFQSLRRLQAPQGQV